MPSVSKAQSRLMRAAAHTPGGYGGVPQKVGKDFEDADKRQNLKKLPEKKGKTKAQKRYGGLVFAARSGLGAHGGESES